MAADITTIFKPHLKDKYTYKGGKNIPQTHKKIYKLSSNENPLGASPKAIASATAALKNIHLYPDQTDFRLREALAEDFNNQINPDQFICSNSGSEIIDMILRAFINPGDEVIFNNPCFLPYAAFSAWYGAKQVDVPLLYPNYELDVKGILKAISPKTKIIFLTSPNNPSGTYIPKKIVEGLLQQLPKNILVVFDEVYRHFAEAADYTTALAYIKKGMPIIGLNSFSKTYGLAGQRLGYAYTTRVIAQYLKLIYKPFLLPQTSIAAGIGALQDKAFISQTIATVLAGKRYLEKLFDDLEIRYWPSQANFILIDPPLEELVFTQKLLEKGIMVRPVSQFGAPGKVRISIGNKEANTALAKALRAIMAP